MRPFLAIGLAVLLAGCGSQTVTSTVTASHAAPSTAAVSTPSKAAFIAQADAICRRVDRKVGPLRSQIGNTNLSKFAAVLNVAVGDEQAAVAQLRSLPEPRGDQAVLAKVWNAIESEIVDLQNAAQAADDDNLGDVQAADTAGQTAQAMYRGLAQGYGFKYCGENGS